MEQSALSLVPPILALVMVMITRKVLLSLGVGIIVGALMINQYSVGESVAQIYSIVKGIIISDGGLNTWNMYIIFFLLLLGVITSLISVTGGSRAFGDWAMKRVKTRVGAQLVTILLGIIIFIDDYFNSLAVGNVSRPLTDRHRVSRAKLAYLIDSTAAPICIISPISSWGAYIIAIIGGLLAAHGVTEVSALSAFMTMIPMNLYAIVAMVLVFASAIFNINLGQMKTHEQRAMKTGEVLDPEKGEVPGASSEFLESAKGKVRDLILPILALIIATVGSMMITGAQNTEGKATILSIFENTDVAASLLYGGLISLAVTIVIFLTKAMSAGNFGTGVWNGIKSMLPAIYILFFAWTLIEIISGLGTGKYLASLVDQHINLAFLPFLLFVIAGFMAFATGTSWGTFGVMLPIAADIAAATDISILLPVLAAVLAGSVFGDHCSPISDTTILSSTGAGSHHIDHVMTQLPYTIASAVISALGYLVLGFTGSVLMALLSALVLLGIFVFVTKNKQTAEA